MDFWNLFDDPTFMFIFHEIICILGSLYYLPHIFTRLREKKEGKKYTVCWKDLKNIVATYVIVAESLLLYEDIKTQGIINPTVAVVTQVLAVIIIAYAYILLKEEPEKKNTQSGKIKMNKAMHIKTDLNLIGMRVDEALPELDKYLDAPVAQGGKNFSGGQRQRLTIARALTRKPEILILDDSTSALDYATDARLRAELKSRKETMTTFIVSQRTSSIQFADKIVVLEDGRIVGLGTHKYLLEHCEVYKEIYDSQYQNVSEEEVAYE